MSDPAALWADIAVEKFRLRGKKLTANIAEAITDGNVETTIKGASTLTLDLRDSSRELLNSRLFKSAVRLLAVDMDWELSGITKQGDTLTLTFEDLRVAALRRQRQRTKATRGKVTRAQFVRSRVMKVRSPKIIFVSPELRKKQPTAKPEALTQKELRRDRGIADDAILKGKEGRLSKGQLRNAERVLDVALNENAGPKATLALVLACIVEAPDFKNPAGGDRDSSGILQVRAGTAESLGIDPRNIEQCARAFLTRGFWGKGGAIKIAKESPGMSAGHVTQNVQGSAYPDRYDQYRSEGRAVIEAYGGAGSGPKNHVEVKKYEFSQGPPGGPKDEDAWVMALRLAEEVGWRRFIVGERFYFASEIDLMHSRPRMTFSEESRGVDAINFDIRAGAKVDHATVICRAALWSAPPGSTVVIKDTGAADGRWLVSSVRRNIYKLNSIIELRRGHELLSEKKEPAPETETHSGSSGSGTGRGSSGDMQRPVQGGSVTGKWNESRGDHLHDGIDIGVSTGTNVRAALGGTVEVAGSYGGYGKYVRLRHAGGLVTFYGHLSKTAVNKGDRVDRGQKIAESGNTGKSSGPHLHFGVWKNGVSVNPEDYI